MRAIAKTVLRLLVLSAFLGGVPGSGAQDSTTDRIDFSSAAIVIPTRDTVLAKAAEMLREEVESRSGVRLEIKGTAADKGVPTIRLGTVENFPETGKSLEPQTEPPEKPEGYALWVSSSGEDAPSVNLLGRDRRGALFAAGRLIRLLFLADGKVELDSDARISTAPVYPIRGHQIGYRNTANSYDAWDLETFEQYLRDLILFGTNSVELITAFDPDEFDGPVMTVPQREMNLKMAELVHSYGLDVWFWMPLEGDVTDPKIAREELETRRRFFEDCVAIDHIMVPGGDPGRTTPAVLMPWLKEMAGVLREFFPDAGLWVSNQKFKPEENDVFFNYLHENHPKWLTGVAYGPGSLITIQETRERTPEEFQLRRYPDITHCVRCQYPVPEWDGVFAQTLGREPPNPRPRGTAHIHNLTAPLSNGFVSYSDGVHDDLAKTIWSSLGWDPDSDVDDILRDYGRVFLGEAVGEEVARGLRMLEENWVGSISENEGIDETLAHWRDIEKSSGESMTENWRLQIYLFRATFDAYTRAKRIAEVGYEREAYAALKQAPRTGAETAIESARRALARADRDRVGFDLRLRMEELAPASLRSIGFQWSVDPPYQSRNPERGALLDKLDRPLNDRPWLEKRFSEILEEADPKKQLESIDRIVNWEDPGEGGFYDDLGCSWKQPHLVRQKTWAEDPMYMGGPQESHYRSMDNSSRIIPPYKLSWLDQAQTLYGEPLRMRYENLDTAASYRLRITYYGRYHSEVRLVADGTIEIHGDLPQPNPIRPVEFEIPREATSDGELDLAWELVKGRGCQVAEVWLLRN